MSILNKMIYEIAPHELTGIMIQIRKAIHNMAFQSGHRREELRVLIPIHLIQLITLKNREDYAHNYNVPKSGEIDGVKVLEHYKNEIVVYSIYWLGKEEYLTKIIEL